MPLVATRNPGETWREAVARIAGKHGLAQECLDVFDNRMEFYGIGEESSAACDALYEWDCLDFEEDQVN